MRHWTCLLIGLLMLGCGGDRATAPVVADPGPSLGTAYPLQGVVDPDQPAYADEHFPLETVQQMFADAKAAGASAYRAYLAARKHAEVLEWAFCACGCEHSDGHLSAVDCFKDMHGYG